jgi:pyruvate dehydrogenase E2 component (dihydrolipoamide acetyltransferase)
MATTVIMPKQGQSVESCVIVSWKKRAGDQVKAGEILCEVETDKATFEVESPAQGTLLSILHDVGSDVPVLAPIAIIGMPSEKVGTPGAGSGVAAAPAPAPAAPAVPSAAPQQAVASPKPAADGRIKASPRAKALAASRGVSLAGIAGTGPGGRIIVRDVPSGSGTAAAERAAPARAAAPAASAPAEGEVREIKVTGVRKLIAERMLASLQGTAQLTMNTSADARTLQDMRRKFKESPEALGLRDVTINDMVLFAVSRSLTRHPDLNALFVGDTIRQHASVHLGFAVDTPRGLMVPVIRNAHTLSLREIAREAARLIKGCREGGVRPEELSGGTFTVTNLGAFGVQSFTPVLNAPQVGIIGVDTITPAPQIAADGSVSFIPHIGLSLTVNHQVVDGAPGARFLQTLAGDIARFDLLLAQ